MNSNINTKIQQYYSYYIKKQSCYNHIKTYIKAIIDDSNEVLQN